MTDPKLPPLPGHPEPHTMQWSELEARVIQDHWLDGYRAGQSSVDPTPPAGDQSAASKLWMLLDDIDTLDDACRNDDRAFRDSVRKIQQKRFAIMDGPTPPAGEQWISVEERMPEDGTPVLVLGSPYGMPRMQSCFAFKSWMGGFCDGDGESGTAVSWATHWMPLPTPPKGGQKP